MKEQMKDTKKGLMKFLQERMNWFINYETNPFRETTMVSYIGEGLNQLNALKVSDETIVVMYDKDNKLEFRIEGDK